MSVSDTAHPVDARAGSAGRRIDLDDVCRYFRVGDTTVKALDPITSSVGGGQRRAGWSCSRAPAPISTNSTAATTKSTAWLGVKPHR